WIAVGGRRPRTSSSCWPASPTSTAIGARMIACARSRPRGCLRRPGWPPPAADRTLGTAVVAGPGDRGARCYTRPAMSDLIGSVLDQVTLTTVVDIGITALLIYWLFSLIRGTRAVRLVIGVSVLIVV